MRSFQPLPIYLGFSFSLSLCVPTVIGIIGSYFKVRESNFSFLASLVQLPAASSTHHSNARVGLRLGNWTILVLIVLTSLVWSLMEVLT